VLGLVRDVVASLLLNHPRHLARAGTYQRLWSWKKGTDKLLYTHTTLKTYL
jgi:hypothetical protein